MALTFRTPPRGGMAILADAVRILGIVSIVVAIVGWSAVDAAVFALVLLGLVVPRFLGVRPGLDAAFGVSLLVAGWSSVLDLYVTVRWWDLPVHFVLNGLLAAVLYILAVRLRTVPDPAMEPVSRSAMVVLMVSFGLAAAVLWEWGEWAGHTFVDDTIFVGYEDTLADMAVGAAGSLAAGLAGPYLTAESRLVDAD